MLLHLKDLRQRIVEGGSVSQKGGSRGSDRRTRALQEARDAGHDCVRSTFQHIDQFRHKYRDYCELFSGIASRPAVICPCCCCTLSRSPTQLSSR